MKPIRRRRPDGEARKPAEPPAEPRPAPPEPGRARRKAPTAAGTTVRAKPPPARTAPTTRGGFRILRSQQEVAEATARAEEQLRRILDAIPPAVRARAAMPKVRQGASLPAGEGEAGTGVAAYPPGR